MSEPRNITITLITAKKPPVISKSFELGAGDTLTKTPGGNMVNGTAQTLRPTLPEFCAGLKALRPNQAFAYGVCEHEAARIVPQKKLQKTKSGDLPVIARDREHFSLSDGPGVLMWDYDPAPDGPPLSRDDLLQIPYSVWLALRVAPHIWTTSASSCIHESATGKELRGLMGQRIYIPVQDARDIPRAGATLVARLWLAGHGRYDVSKSGAVLERGPVDASVWQPERLDFAGGAHCGPGLEQRRPEPILYNAEAPFIDSRETLPDLTDEEKRTVQELKLEARKAKRPEVALRQEEWIEERIKKGIENVPIERHDAEKKRLGDLYRRAVTEKRLFGDFTLYSAQHGAVTVAEILDNPNKFDGDRFRDPLEPDYGNDPRIAIAKIKDQTHPYVFSHAHGGQRFSLHRVLDVIRIEGGELHRIIEKVLHLMQQDHTVYDRGELVRIANGCAYPATSGWLSVYLNGLVAFDKWNARQGAWSRVDCPDSLSKKITELAGLWGLPRLNGIITAPTITGDGRVIERHGYDRESGLYLEFPNAPDWKRVEERPGERAVQEAVKRLWWPFRDFPFETPVDAGVHLATALTAVVRQSLPQAPATLYGAPVAGTGKTMLAICDSLLAGQEPTVYPPTESEEEMRKRLAAVVRAGLRAVIVDNLVGLLKSSSLCAFLSSTSFSERVLGESTNMSAPTNFMTILTGNNVALHGDLNRRVLRCVIDPRCERPDKRRFDLHPPTYVKTHRLEMIHAALTILKGFIAAGAPKPADALGDYIEWSNLVRGSVVWVGANRWLDVADPAGSIDSAYGEDDETRQLRALLTAWKLSFGINEGATASLAVKRACNEAGGDLYESIKAVAERRDCLNSTLLGYWLRAHKGRFVDNLRFVQSGKKDGSARWKVEAALEIQSKGDKGDTGDVSNPLRENRKEKYTHIHVCEIYKGAETIPLIPSIPLPPQAIEAQEERAAIMEYDGGLSRAEAERTSRAPEGAIS